MTLLAAAALAASLAGAQAPGTDAPGRSAQMLNLSCVEALVASGRPELAGVFSFVAEKDTPAAFADLVVHDNKALRKYVAKLDKDYKAANAITEWDHSAVEMILSIYGSPLGETVERPATKVMGRLAELGQVRTTTLDQVSSRRGHS